MGRTIRFLGLIVLAAATWYLVAGEVGWISATVADRWFLPLAGLGVAILVGGMALGALDPALRWVRRGRCVRCGAATERGQVFCLDHLRETVREAQDSGRHHTFRGRR